MSFSALPRPRNCGPTTAPPDRVLRKGQQHWHASLIGKRFAWPMWTPLARMAARSQRPVDLTT
eukprot:2342687-Lingulodinium_polyedra.AAC.1